MTEQNGELIKKYLIETDETEKINIFNRLGINEKREYADKIEKWYKENQYTPIKSIDEIECLDNINEDIIAVRCEKGHIYWIDSTSENFDKEIKMKCPVCQGKKIHYSIKDNTDSLETLANALPKTFGYLNKAKIYIDDEPVSAKDIKFYSSNEKIRFDLDEDMFDGCYKVVKEYYEPYNRKVEDYPYRLILITILYLRDFELAELNNIKEQVKGTPYLSDIGSSHYYIDEDNSLKTIRFEGFLMDRDYFSEDLWKDTYGNTFYNGMSISQHRVTLFQKIRIYERRDISKGRSTAFLSKEHRQIYSDIMENANNLMMIAQEIRENARKLIFEASNIEKEAKEIRKEARKLRIIPEKRDRDKDIQSQSLLEWCQQPENKEIGDIVINHYMKNKNKFKLDEIPYDCKEVIWLKGNHGTNFKTTPSCITGKRKILPKLPKGTSYPELFIFFYMRSLYINTIHRGKALGKVEYDITIPELKMCIEYNGAVYHKIKYDKTETDNNKVQLCKQYGVNFISVEDDGETEEPKINGHKISYKYRKDSKVLYNLCEFIRNNIIHTSKEACDIKEIEKSIDLYI